MRSLVSVREAGWRGSRGAPRLEAVCCGVERVRARPRSRIGGRRSEHPGAPIARLPTARRRGERYPPQRSPARGRSKRASPSSSAARRTDASSSGSRPAAEVATESGAPYHGRHLVSADGRWIASAPAACAGCALAAALLRRRAPTRGRPPGNVHISSERRRRRRPRLRGLRPARQRKDSGHRPPCRPRSEVRQRRRDRAGSARGDRRCLSRSGAAGRQGRGDSAHPVDAGVPDRPVPRTKRHADLRALACHKVAAGRVDLLLATRAEARADRRGNRRLSLQDRCSSRSTC